jgi:hypothetical protein
VPEKVIELASQGSSEVVVRLRVRAPKWAPEAKLWDRHGRNPERLDEVERTGSGCEWHLKGDVADLDGRTLSWWVRVQAKEPARFELRVDVMRDGEVLRNGDFHYAGALEESEVEDLSGRFHFVRR